MYLRPHVVNIMGSRFLSAKDPSTLTYAFYTCLKQTLFVSKILKQNKICITCTTTAYKKSYVYLESRNHANMLTPNCMAVVYLKRRDAGRKTLLS